jgi:hypothetical protein
MRLLDFAANVYSQCGEDGILAKILETLSERDGWCCEFGAWDGAHLSNTRHLIESAGYSAVLIEASRQRFEQLRQRHETNPKVTALNARVGFTPTDGLDALLSGTTIPRDFDVLSVDIDGNDYHVWQAVTAYVPKVVVIEFNPTIPTEVDYVQPADPRIQQGASVAALVRLARQKGYDLAAVTSWNAVFVRRNEFARLGITDNHPRILREDVTRVAHIFSGYDGTILLAGCPHLPWHGVRYAARIRQLPCWFRAYPDDFGPLKTWLFRAYRKLAQLMRHG